MNHRDMIGPAWVGHWIGPGERDVPDPDEYLKVLARSLKARSGMLSFASWKPMEERVTSTVCGWWPSIIGA